jgi:hypothetical protein
MSRVILEIDNSLPRNELFAFLKENKKALIAQKKAIKKDFYSAVPGPMYGVKDIGKDVFEMKAPGDAVIPDTATSLMVSAAANTSMWCDTGMDVLLKNAGKKSMKERKGMIPQIYDHKWSILSEIGDVKDIYYQELPLRQLGLKQEGTAQVLTVDFECIKAYNPDVFEKYRLKKIKQHSIGIWYEDIQLAINAPDDDYWEEEYKVWKKYIDQIINKELPESRGYFFAVSQFTLLENSAVLLGANFLTPTISTSEKEATSDTPPESGTGSGPEPNAFNVDDYLKTVKFFN